MKTIPRNKDISTFETEMQAIEKVMPGEIIKFELKDAYDGQIDSEDKFRDQLDNSTVCHATGPLFIEGAERGDLLQVKVLDIFLADKGAAVIKPGGGVLGETVNKAKTRILTKTEKSYYRFLNMKIPARPHIGMIGVAPLEGKYSSRVPWKHGGNMDVNEITEGSTLFLPVGQEGGLLAMGDCHAMMGEGELSSGCEISAEVIVKVDVIKNKKIEWPLVETKDYTIVIASGDNEFDTAKEAAKQAVDLLSRGLGLSWDDALILGSLTVDLKICQLTNAKKTIKATIPQSIVSTQKLIEALAVSSV